jgi:hypothetical protein
MFKQNNPIPPTKKERRKGKSRPQSMHTAYPIGVRAMQKKP